MNGVSGSESVGCHPRPVHCCNPSEQVETTTVETDVGTADETGHEPDSPITDEAAQESPCMDAMGTVMQVLQALVSALAPALGSTTGAAATGTNVTNVAPVNSEPAGQFGSGLGHTDR